MVKKDSFNQGGRPKLPLGEVKAHSVGSRYTAEEFIFVCEKAQSVGLARSDYVRSCVLKGLKSYRKKSVKERRMATGKLFDPEMYNQIRRIGLNLNQIARRFNEIPQQPPEELGQAIEELRTMMNKLTVGLSEYD